MMAVLADGGAVDVGVEGFPVPISDEGCVVSGVGSSERSGCDIGIVGVSWTCRSTGVSGTFVSFFIEGLTSLGKGRRLLLAGKGASGEEYHGS